MLNKDFHKFIKERYPNTLAQKNKDEYPSEISRLVSENKIEVHSIKKQQIENFNNTMKTLSKKNGAFLKTNFDDPNFKIEMDYPRNKFIQDIEDALQGLSPAEKQKITEYFGFEISKLDGKSFMFGYPRVLKDKEKFYTPIEKKLEKLVKKFTVENKIKVPGNPALSKELNDIFDVFPELKGIIGKTQHRVHDFTLDIHTLKVLQGVMKNLKYQKLSIEDKKTLSLSALLHDISKKEGLVDKQHPQNSANDAYRLLDKINLYKAEKIRIYTLIQNHDWLEKYNQKDLSPQQKIEKAQQIAYRLKDGNNFELASILTEADLKGVNKNNAFYNNYKQALNNGIKKISALVSKMQTSTV